MSEGRKRSRKSKLEVREDYCEFEVACDDTNTSADIALQKIPKLGPTNEHQEYLIYHDHDYCKPNSFNLLYRKLFFAPKYTSNVIRKSSNNKELKEKVEESKFKNLFTSSVLGKMHANVYACVNKGKVGPKLRMIKYDPDTLLSESKKLAQTSNNDVDRILDIELRNIWGSSLRVLHKPSIQEEKLQLAIDAWQVWCSDTRLVREPPLFYQCHICMIAWWRLQPFRDHIHTHDAQKLLVSIKEHLHEIFIVASYENVDKLIYMETGEDCYRCGENVEYHQIHCLGYKCKRCSKSFYTCTSLRSHEVTCLYSNMGIFNVSSDRCCPVCLIVTDSVALMQKHLIQAHTIRSDLPVHIIMKTCSYCNEKYLVYSFHDCYNKHNRNVGCQHCCRKFINARSSVLHEITYANMPKECRFCDVQLKAKCQEMEHLITHHSDNYKLVYKCTKCTDQHQLFLDESSMKLHRQYWHMKKFDKRRMFFEMMLVPKTCLGDVRVGGVEKPLSTDGTISRQSPSTSKEPPAEVTIDGVEIKKEPSEYQEDEKQGYEEMLFKMFNQSAEDVPVMKVKKAVTKKASVTKVEEVTKTAEAVIKTADSEEEKVEFDINSVKIKAEPMDDIDITDNPIEEVQVKAEPVDPTESPFEPMLVCEAVKVEHDVESNEMDIPDTENVITGDRVDVTIVKEEVDAKDAKTDGFEELITELDMFKYEYSIDIVNQKGLVKKKIMYTCVKCGYTAHHKQYRLHLSSKCAVSPGANCSYPCSRCGRTFENFRSYVIHFEKHGYEMMSCFVCGLKFNVTVRFLSHVNKHIKNSFVGIHMIDKKGKEIKRAQKRVTCQECQQTVNHDTMFTHWEVHLNDNAQKTSDEEQNLVIVKEEPPELTVDFERVTMNNKELEPAVLKLALDSLQVESNEKECVICYRAFNRRHDLKRHIVEHLLMDAHMKKIKFRDFRCQICSEGFPHQDRYKFHMRGHGGMPIFMCELCDKTFSDSSNFAKHKKTHNVRCLICDICNKKFHSKAFLEKHIEEHSSKPMTKCSHCPRVFHSKTSFKKHRYQMHQKHRYKCILCDVFFTSLQLKWDHDWEVHQERKQAADCPICLKSFRKFSDVKVHARCEHDAEVAVIRDSGGGGPQLYKVKDLRLREETLVVCE